MNKTKANKLYEELEIYSKELRDRKHQLWQKVMIEAICSLKMPQPIQNCCKKIDLTQFPHFSEQIIGQILGKGGIHRAEFMRITNVNLEIDKDLENCVILSKYNPVDVEKAKMLIVRLLKKTNWSAENMQKQYDLVQEEFKEQCIATGSKMLKHYLKYTEFSDRLAEIVGLLKYSFSYNQNMLNHCQEVAQLCANIASELSLDVLMAKRAGFFHDIGKSIANYEDHVKIGAEIAKSEKLDAYILNAIESHHGKTKTNNVYSMLVKAMDKISAGRIGARPLQMELIKKRTDNISSELMQLTWIERVSLRNAGNLIQIFIKLKEFDYAKIKKMKEEIKEVLNKMKETYEYNYEIELKLMYSECFLFNDIPDKEKTTENNLNETDFSQDVFQNPVIDPIDTISEDYVMQPMEEPNLIIEDEEINVEEITEKKPENKFFNKNKTRKYPIRKYNKTPKINQTDEISQNNYSKTEELSLDKSESSEHSLEDKKDIKQKKYRFNNSFKKYKNYKTNGYRKKIYKNNSSELTKKPQRITKRTISNDKTEIRHGNEFVGE